MQIEYVPQFKLAFHNIMECGQKYYSKKTISLFYLSLKRHKELLMDNPLLGQAEPLLSEYSDEYRYIVLHKYLKLIYCVIGDVIYFVDIWDTRQSPEILTNRIN